MSDPIIFLGGDELGLQTHLSNQIPSIGHKGGKVVRPTFDQQPITKIASGEIRLKGSDHTADAILSLKDLDAVAITRQIPSGRKPADASSDHCDSIHAIIVQFSALRSVAGGSRTHTTL